jgi:hypothetical protein
LCRTIAWTHSQAAYETLDRLRKSSTSLRAIHIHHAQFFACEPKDGSPPLRQKKYIDFERDLTAGITNSTSFAMAIYSDLLAVKYDIEHGEHSLRRFFNHVMLHGFVSEERANRANLAVESDFQTLLASELHHYARERYSISLEPHTAEGKRRDILCSTGSMVASIELKMSMRWTVNDYITALEKQLVGQYMRHRRAAIGFLVLVLQMPRTWIEPISRSRISFEELVVLLSARAQAIEAKDPQKHLRVIGIDATTPPNFRRSRKASPATLT